MLAVGLLFIGLAVIMALADSDQLSGRMPTQVPPRAYAFVPLLVGVALVAADLLN